MTLLRLENVCKSYGGVTALRDLSFSVAADEIVGLMGANGAGKTTAFSLIAGTQRPTSGKIWFEENRIDGNAPYVAARLGIGRTFQIVRPFNGLRVIDNLAIAALYGHRPEHSRRSAEERAREILSDVGLSDDAQKPAVTLTLARRKRLEIARALASGARLLLLDEVLAGLTTNETLEAIELIRSVHRRYHLTLIVIEHFIRALTRLCGRIIVLHHGEKLAEGAPEAVVADQRVIDSYLGARQR